LKQSKPSHSSTLVAVLALHGAVGVHTSTKSFSIRRFSMMNSCRSWVFIFREERE
jgi:hypothetical protein